MAKSRRKRSDILGDLLGGPRRVPGAPRGMGGEPFHAPTDPPPDPARMTGEIVGPDGTRMWIDPATGAVTTVPPGGAATTDAYRDFHARRELANRATRQQGGAYTRTGRGGINPEFQPTIGPRTRRLWTERVAPQPPAEPETMAEPAAPPTGPAAAPQPGAPGAATPTVPGVPVPSVPSAPPGPMDPLQRELVRKTAVGNLTNELRLNYGRMTRTEADGLARQGIARITPESLGLDGKDPFGNPDRLEMDAIDNLERLKEAAASGKGNPQDILEEVNKLAQQRSTGKVTEREKLKRQEEQERAERQKQEGKERRARREKVITIQLGDAKEDLAEAKVQETEVRAEITALRAEEAKLEGVDRATVTNKKGEVVKGGLSDEEAQRMEWIGDRLAVLEGEPGVPGELQAAQNAVREAREAHRRARQARTTFYTEQDEPPPTFSVGVSRLQGERADATPPAGAAQPAVAEAPPAAAPETSQELPPLPEDAELPKPEPGRNDWREDFPVSTPLGVPGMARTIVTGEGGEVGPDGFYWTVTGPDKVQWRIAKRNNDEWSFEPVKGGDEFILDKEGARWHVPRNRAKRKKGWLSPWMARQYMDEAARRLGAAAPMDKITELARMLSKGLDQ